MTTANTTEEIEICCNNCNQFINEVIHNAAIIIDNNPHCIDCACHCENCNQAMLLDDSQFDEVEEQLLCDRCFENSHTTCNECGCTIHINNARTDANNNDYCNSCADDYLYTCYSCEETYHNDYMHNGSDDNYRCSSCHEHYEDEQRALNKIPTFEDYTLNCCDNILSYDSKPDFNFHKQKTDNNAPLYLGIELELNFDMSKFYKINNLTREYFPKKYIFKEDGSIGEGAELVLAPLSYKTLKTINFKKYFEELKALKVTSYENNSCGLHVHLSDNTEEFHLKAKTFFLYNFNKILKFSKRDEDQLNKWARIETNIHEINSSRYSAINYTEDTNEIRIFRGTINYNRFKSTLLFCVSLHHFLKTKKLETIQKKCPTFTDYKNFLKTYSNYNFLTKYLLNQNI